MYSMSFPAQSNYKERFQEKKIYKERQFVYKRCDSVVNLILKQFFLTED